MDKITCIVRENKSNGQLVITIPKGSHIQAGDAVRITKLEEIYNGRTQ